MHDRGYLENACQLFKKGGSIGPRDAMRTYQKNRSISRGPSQRRAMCVESFESSERRLPRQPTSGD